MDSQRIDKWLWHARLVRSRSAAAALTAGGHVRLNGQRVLLPSRPLRPGDVVTVALDRAVRVLRVAGFSERRGNAAAGRALYRDLTRASGRRASDSDGPSRNIARSPRGATPGLIPWK